MESDATLIDHFANNVRSLCDLIESHSSFEKYDFLNGCRLLLSNLYFLGLNLPEGDYHEGIKRIPYGHDNWLKLYESLQIYLNDDDTYYKLGNPFEEEEVYPVTISNDLSEIVQSMKPSLLLYEKNTKEYMEAAIFEWKLNFFHWGEHIICVLYPLHELLDE